MNTWKAESDGSGNENPKNAFVYFSEEINPDSGVTLGASWVPEVGERRRITAKAKRALFILLLKTCESYPQKDDRNNGTGLVNAVDSMGRRNTKPKSPYKGLNN